MPLNSIESVAILIRWNIIEISITFWIIIISIIILIYCISVSMGRMSRFDIFIMNLILHDIRIPLRSIPTGIFPHIFPVIIITVCVDNIYSILCICIEFYFFVMVYWWVIDIIGIGNCLGCCWYGLGLYLVIGKVVVARITNVICYCCCGYLIYWKRMSFHVLGYWYSWCD